MTFRSWSSQTFRCIPHSHALVRAFLLSCLLVSPLLSSRAAFAQGSPQADDPQHPPAAPPAELDRRSIAAFPLPPIPMPQDRAEASYYIYSLLMPVGELGNPGWPRDLWLLGDTTLSLVPPDETCVPEDASRASNYNMNPHIAIQPPPDRIPDFLEMLEDFDRRCHERIRLSQELFRMVVPLRLLSQEEQSEFVSARFDTNGGTEADAITARYKGAPGLSRFSQVYFNAHHTLAMVYASGWCGGLCAQSYWQVLEFKDGQWKMLHWNSNFIVS